MGGKKMGCSGAIINIWPCTLRRFITLPGKGGGHVCEPPSFMTLPPLNLTVLNDIPNPEALGK